MFSQLTSIFSHSVVFYEKYDTTEQQKTKGGYDIIYKNLSF